MSKEKFVNNEWSVSDTLNEAWKKVRGMKASFWGAAIIVIIINIIISTIVNHIELINSTPASLDQLQPGTHHLLIQTIKHEKLHLNPAMLALGILVNIIAVLFINLPLNAGLVLIGIRRAANKSIRFNYIFKLFKQDYIWRIAGLCSLLFIIFIGVFFVISLFGALLKSYAVAETIISILFICMVIYLAVTFYPAMALVIDRKINPWNAVALSFTTVNKNWFKVFGVLLLTLIITAISAIPLLIGLIWTWPMIFNINGIVYRELFGIAGDDPVTRAEHKKVDNLSTDQSPA